METTIDGTGGDGAEVVVPATPEEQIAHLEAELAAAKEMAAKAEKDVLYVRADFENSRKRLQQSYADQARRQQKGLLGKMLAVLDNLDRAVAYGESPAVDAERMMQGVRLTHSLLRDALVAEGVKEIAAAGEMFDPAVHEAIASEVAPDRPDGQIIAELQRGYRFGDELLRPSLVRVATRE
jgi:molecular chaperone GrpE